MILSDLIVTVAYLETAGLGCITRCTYTSHCLVCKIILFILSTALRSLDNFSHWQVWITIRESGLNHPLLKLPDTWTKAWLVFTCIGTGMAVIYIVNELSGVIGFYREYKKIAREDICLPCSAVGLNHITRIEILSLVNIIVEELPLLVLSLLFAAAQYTCNHPTPTENVPVLKVVFYSSLSSLLQIGWSLFRFIFHLLLRAYSNCRAKTNLSDTNKAKDLKAKMKAKELEMSPKKSKSRISQRQLYPSKHRKVKWCITCHSITMLLVCGLTITISVTAIALTQNKDTLTNNFSFDPSQQLSVYRDYPQEYILINVSTIINSKTAICLHEKFVNKENTTISCDVIFSYSNSEGVLYFNYAGSIQNTSSITTNTTMIDSTDKCGIYHEGLFLGYYTEEGVRRFDETCLSVLILQSNDELLQKQDSLLVNSSTCII